MYAKIIVRIVWQFLFVHFTEIRARASISRTRRCLHEPSQSATLSLGRRRLFLLMCPSMEQWSRFVSRNFQANCFFFYFSFILALHHSSPPWSPVINSLHHPTLPLYSFRGELSRVIWDIFRISQTVEESFDPMIPIKSSWGLGNTLTSTEGSGWGGSASHHLFWCILGLEEGIWCNINHKKSSKDPQYNSYSKILC